MLQEMVCNGLYLLQVELVVLELMVMRLDGHGTSTLAASGALRDDGTNVAINALPGVGNTKVYVVASLTTSTSTTGIYYYQYNNTASWIGMKSVVGDYYTGSGEIVGVQGVASGLNTTGLRYGVQGISVVPSSGTNIGIYGWSSKYWKWKFITLLDLKMVTKLLVKVLGLPNSSRRRSMGYITILEDFML